MIEGLRRSRVLTFPARRNPATRRLQFRRDALRWLLVAAVAWLVSGVLRAEEFRMVEALARMEASAYGYLPSVTLDLESDEEASAPRWYSLDQHWTSIKSGFGSLFGHLRLKSSSGDGDAPALMSFIRRNIYTDEEASLLFKRRLLYGERSVAHIRAGYGLHFGPSNIPTTQPCVGGEVEQRYFYLKTSFHF